MTHRAISRDHALTSQHALSEEEYAAAMLVSGRTPMGVRRVPAGERDLAGDLIGESVGSHD